MRTTAIRAAGAALLGVALLGTAACSSEQLSKNDDAAGGAASTEGTQTDPAGAPAEDSAEAEDAADGLVTEPIEAPEKPVGTRAHPLPVGSEFTDGDWTVTLGQPHEGWEEIHAAESYNERPEEGTEYWLVPVTVTYIGEESGAPWLDLQFGFVSEEGRSYSDWCPAIVPDDLMEVDDLYTDATVEGNVCLQLPADPEGQWTVASGWGDPVFFAADGSDGDA